MKKILFIIYALFLLSLTLFSYLFIDPNLTYLKNAYSGFAFSHRREVTILYVLIIFLFFIFYFLFLWLLNKKKISYKDIRLLILTTVALLFFSYPAMLSFDIFNYIATAKVLFFYHENPYIIMPIEFANDPLLSFTHAANKIALYGPLWIVLTAIPNFLGSGNFLIILFSFKLFVILFYLGITLLIFKISKNLLSVSLFALNPLVVIETLVSGHNDIVMMFFALFSFFLLMRKRSITIALISFVISVFIKYATIFLLPVFIYACWKTIQKRTINWTKIFYFSSLLMFLAFLLSPVREEIYPWYAIWFLAFVSLIPQKRMLLYILLAFSFSLLFRYVPFMYLGTHFGLTPSFKIILTVIPALVVFVTLLWKGRAILKH